MTALDHHVVVKELPKTKQAHLIRLDSATVSMLRQVRAHQAEAKLWLGPGYQDDGYVFCHFDGWPHHLSERLNHSSTHVTREIYTQLSPPMQSDAAERVAKLIDGSWVTLKQPAEHVRCADVGSGGSCAPARRTSDQPERVISGSV